MAVNNETHKIVTVHMPKDLHEALKALAKKNRRSVSAEICILVEKAVQETGIKQE